MATVTVHGDAGHETRANALAARLGLPRGDGGDVWLCVTAERLELRVQRDAEAALVGGSAVACDWMKLDTTSPAGRSRKAPLLRAVWPRRWPEPPRVLDATAGLGEDGWLLARAGCRVTAAERDNVVFALLEDGHRRAAASVTPGVAAAAERLELVHGDALDVLRAWPQHAIPEVVALDPMFHAARKATERKPMRVLRRILRDVGDHASAIRDVALERGVRRVVVKRPRLGNALPGPPANHRVEGKAIRFDVYL